MRISKAGSQLRVGFRRNRGEQNMACVQTTSSLESVGTPRDMLPNSLHTQFQKKSRRRRYCGIASNALWITTIPVISQGNTRILRFVDEMSGWSCMARNIGRRTAQNLLSYKPRVSATVKPSAPASLKPVNKTPVAPASQGLGGRPMQSPLLSRSDSFDAVYNKLTWLTDNAITFLSVCFSAACSETQDLSLPSALITAKPRFAKQLPRWTATDK